MTTATSASTETPGPRLLSERTLLGIFVHLIAFFSGIIGAGLIYYLSSHEFTRENARNAFNWHLTYLLVVLFGLGLFFLVVLFDEYDFFGLPGVIEGGLTLIAFVAVFVMLIFMTLSLFFWLIATVKAIFGTAWSYPLAREFL